MPVGSVGLISRVCRLQRTWEVAEHPLLQEGLCSEAIVVIRCQAHFSLDDVGAIVRLCGQLVTLILPLHDLYPGAQHAQAEIDGRHAETMAGLTKEAENMCRHFAVPIDLRPSGMSAQTM
jgi:hypothetical protein